MVDADVYFRIIFGTIILIIGIVIIVEGFRIGGSSKSGYIVSGIGVMVFSIAVYLDAVPSTSTLLLLSY